MNPPTREPRMTGDAIQREKELEQQIINAQHRGDTPHVRELMRERRRIRDGGRP